MDGDLLRLQAALVGYVADDDRSSILSSQTQSALDRVEDSLSGHEHEVPVDLAVLLAQTHLARYQVLPDGAGQAALESAIAWYRRVLRRHPDRVPREIRELFAEGALTGGDPEFGDPERLQDAELESTVGRLEELAATGTVKWRANLAALLVVAYERWGRTEDLDRAIDVGRGVTQDDRATDSERLTAQINLAGALLDRFTRCSDRAALEEALRHYEWAVTQRGSAVDHANVGMAYLTRYDLSHDTADLDLAVDHAREAVRRTPESDPDLPARISNLAAAIRARYDRAGAKEDIDEACTLAERAVEMSSADDPAHARRLSNLAAALSTRFEMSGVQEDIDRAVTVARLSTSSGPDDGAAGRVSNLMLALHLRGAATGRLEDLQEALRLGREIAGVIPADHADRPDILSNAAGAAMSWFDWTGDIVAITEAVELSLEALDADNDPERLRVLSTNLSMHLLTRFEVAGDETDVEAAIHHAERGMSGVHGPATAVAASNLSVCLRTRFELSRSTADLTRAVALARMAAGSVPAHHRDWAAYESNLGLCLWHAGRRTDALAHSRAALAAPTSAGTSSRSAYAANLARMLSQARGVPGEIAELWTIVARNPAAPVPLRIEAHMELAMSGGGSSRAATEHLALAVGLLPAAAWHGVGVPSRTRRLAEWQELGRDAAAAALGAADQGPEAAVVLLDSALSQLWAREVLSTPAEERLRREYPELADRLRQLRAALNR